MGHVQVPFPCGLRTQSINSNRDDTRVKSSDMLQTSLTQIYSTNQEFYFVCA